MMQGEPQGVSVGEDVPVGAAPVAVPGEVAEPLDVPVGVPPVLVAVPLADREDTEEEEAEELTEGLPVFENEARGVKLPPPDPVGVELEEGLPVALIVWRGVGVGGELPVLLVDGGGERKEDDVCNPVRVGRGEGEEEEEGRADRVALGLAVTRALTVQEPVVVADTVGRRETEGDLEAEELPEGERDAAMTVALMVGEVKDEAVVEGEAELVEGGVGVAVERGEAVPVLEPA